MRFPNQRLAQLFDLLQNETLPQDELAQRLSVEFGKGFSVQSLRNFRQFFLTFNEDQIRSTAWSELGWSHFKLLMRVSDPAARQGYATLGEFGDRHGLEGMRQALSVRFKKRPAAANDDDQEGHNVENKKKRGGVGVGEGDGRVN